MGIAGIQPPLPLPGVSAEAFDARGVTLLRSRSTMRILTAYDDLKGEVALLGFLEFFFGIECGVAEACVDVPKAVRGDLIRRIVLISSTMRRVAEQRESVLAQHAAHDPVWNFP